MEFSMRSDMVLVKKIEATPLSSVIETTFGDDDKVWYADVIATGPGRKAKKTGKVIPMEVIKGDKVMIGSHSGERHYMLDGEIGDLVVIREPDITAIVG